MQQVNGVNVYTSDPSLLYGGLDQEPTWFSAQGGVYQCYERTTHRAVAIKKYLVEEHHHPDMFVMPKELVENEIYTMTKCNQANILKLYSVHLYKEFVYLIMPLCAGGSLQQYVYEHHLTIGQLSYIVASIAAGLEEIHRHGYIHRDIKCDNVFLDRDSNNVVIGDFGVVSITPAADSSVEEAGVVLFWAPELVRGKMVNRKIDIWALGIVILEIINGGRAPYEDEKLDDDQIKQRILANGKPAYPEGLPSRLVNLLDACLNPDPRGRASAADILKHPFIVDYHHEQLFTTINESEDNSNTSDTVVDTESMLDALKSLQAMKSIDELDGDMHVTFAAGAQHSMDGQIACRSRSAKPRKCRLPVPAFILDQDKSNAIPAQEKIASVRQKRQSLSAEHRSQGSRLPMLKIILEMPERPPSPPVLLSPTGKKLRKAKSVRLPSIKSAHPPLTRAASPPLPPYMPHAPPDASKSPVHMRANTMPPSANDESNNNDNNSYRLGSVSSDDASNAPEYRQKRLPQSRTARLMMGISTTGRQSARSPPASPDRTVSTSAKRFSALTASLSTNKRPDVKPRPLSFSGPKSTASSARHPAPPPLPPFPTHLKQPPTTFAVSPKSPTASSSNAAAAGLTSPRRRHFSVPSSKRDRRDTNPAASVAVAPNAAQTHAKTTTSTPSSDPMQKTNALNSVEALSAY
ncbi:kinase-like domain-containing protein [Gongronella butleri]|nr:kinase-like domain-containing protein [Gongronella butleri]